MSSRHIPRRCAATAVVACGLALSHGVLAPPAAAHTELTGSSPEADAKPAEPPAVLSLSFSDAMDPELSRIAVTGPDGEKITSGSVQVEGGKITQRLEDDVPAGAYTVSYRVVSADGHPVSGTYRYRLNASAGATQEPQPGGIQPSPSSDSPRTDASTGAGEAQEENAEAATQALPGTVKATLAGSLLVGLAVIAYVWFRQRGRHDA